MCIDLFRVGSRLDVPLLLEQIWFSVDEQHPGKLEITGVYDVLLKNPKGAPVLTEVWALFPPTFGGCVSPCAARYAA